MSTALFSRSGLLDWSATCRLRLKHLSNTKHLKWDDRGHYRGAKSNSFDESDNTGVCLSAHDDWRSLPALEASDGWVCSKFITTIPFRYCVWPHPLVIQTISRDLNNLGQRCPSQGPVEIRIWGCKGWDTALDLKWQHDKVSGWIEGLAEQANG